jgi:anti-sigma factor RsiW
MNCESVKNQISEYIDNEVSHEQQLRIEQHLEACESCRAEVSQFMALGNLMRQSEATVDTESIWQQVSARLEVHSRTTLLPKKSAKWVYAILVTAASFSLVWFAISRSLDTHSGDHESEHSQNEHANLAADFQDVFRLARTEPTVAIANLVAKYQGQELSRSATTAYLGYEPALFKTLPDGFTRTSTHVLNMPCCKCSATICQRTDGTSLVVFEHKDEQLVWFGDANSIETQCAGKTCRIVGSTGQLAVSWKNQDRQLTLIGVTDLSEVSDWVDSMKL